MPPFFMSKNQLTKDELRTRVLKLKSNLGQEYTEYNSKELAHKYLDKVLNIIDEYRY